MTQKSAKFYDSAKRIVSKIWCHVHFKLSKKTVQEHLIIWTTLKVVLWYPAIAV